MSSKKLFAEFPPVATTEWEATITKDLKGADYNKKLVWKPTAELAVRPYYRAEDLNNVAHTDAQPAEYPYVRGTHADNNWRVRQTYCACNDVAAANAQALDALMKGVDSVGFCVPPDVSVADLTALLRGIFFDAAHLTLVPCTGCGCTLATKLAEAAKALGADPKKAHFTVDANPLRTLTVTGKWNDAAFDKLKDAVVAVKDFAYFRVIGVSGAALHNAGATAIQELAFALNMGNEYLAALTERGLTIDEIAPRVKFTFAIGANYFLEIAKIRAARLLWANIVSAYKPQSACAGKMKIHAVTSAYNQTVYDAYVNMLRGTTEAMSAAISGVDSLEVLRFDKPFKSPTDFSERIARNTQILLKEESHFDQVTDPAAGSYYIETLTQELANAAWKLFCDTENKGGYLAVFKAGAIQQQIVESAHKRDALLASRREVLLGTNQYPNFTETVGKEAAQKLSEGSACGCESGCGCGNDGGDAKACTCGSGCETKSGAEKIAEPLKAYRGAQAFETLRLQTEAAKKTPEAFMLTFGNLAMCRARAQFACNFFAIAGFKVTDNNQFTDIDKGVEAALAVGAEVIVACSSDEEYADAVPQIAAKLGKRAVLVVAGEPECKADLQSKGITHFISVKSNVLETLKEYQKEIGL